jgi:hypothetical protein
MIAAGSLRFVAAVGAGGRPMIAAAARHLAACLRTATGTDWLVDAVVAAPGARDLPEGVAVVASIADDMGTAREPLDDIAARWRIRLERHGAGGRRVLLCNLFRHAGDRGQADGIAHIRRLDRLAIALSRDTGAEVVDIDRLFALCGGALVRSGGDMLAGHAIAAAMLDGALGTALDPAAQERAARALGGWREIAETLRHRVRKGDGS